MDSTFRAHAESSLYWPTGMAGIRPGSRELSVRAARSHEHLQGAAQRRREAPRAPRPRFPRLRTAAAGLARP
jgi:hypothetical protein